MDNSSTKESKAEPVSKKHTSLFKVLSSNIKTHKRFSTKVSENSSKNKIMNNGRFKIQLSSSKSIQLVTISKKRSNTCSLRRPSKCRSCGMNLNTLSNNYSTRPEGPLCWIISPVERAFWTLGSNTRDTWAKTSRNGVNLFNFIVMSTIHGKQRMMSITVTSS